MPEKIELLNLDIDQLDFNDRFGQWRSTRGCSLAGRESFNAYVQMLSELIQSADSSLPVAELYSSNDEFRYVCDRCLELNGIDTEWLDGKGALLTSLLFTHDDGLGMLIRLNMIPTANQSKKKGDGAAVADVGASILAATNDLKQAMEALNHPDGKSVLKLIEARSKQIQAQERTSKRRKPPGFEEWRQKQQQRNQETAPQTVNMTKLRALTNATVR